MVLQNRTGEAELIDYQTKVCITSDEHRTLHGSNILDPTRGFYHIFKVTYVLGSIGPKVGIEAGPGCGESWAFPLYASFARHLPAARRTFDGGREGKLGQTIATTHQGSHAEYRHVDTSSAPPRPGVGRRSAGRAGRHGRQTGHDQPEADPQPSGDGMFPFPSSMKLAHNSTLF